MSANANRHRTKRLCPFNNLKFRTAPKTKRKTHSAFAVFSMKTKSSSLAQFVLGSNGWLADDAAEFFLWADAKWTTLTEVRLKDAEGGSAGNIDVVLCAYDKAGQGLWFRGRLEVQAVYISGNVRNPFEHYMESPAKNYKNGWTEEAHYPRQIIFHHLASGLAPTTDFQRRNHQMLGARKRLSLSIRAFFNTLPKIAEVPKEKADIACEMIYDLKPQANAGQHYELSSERIVYTRFEPCIESNNKIPSRKDGRFYLSFAGEVDEEAGNATINAHLKIHSANDVSQTFLLPEHR